MHEHHARDERGAGDEGHEERTASMVSTPIGGEPPESDEKRDSHERPENAVAAHGAQSHRCQRTDDHRHARTAQRCEDGAEHARGIRPPHDSLHLVPRILAHEGRSQHDDASSPPCMGGQGTAPWEQNTQQSPALGRITARHALHSWKNTQASVGMGSISAWPHAGHRSSDVRTIEGVILSIYQHARSCRCPATSARPRPSPASIPSVPMRKPAWAAAGSRTHVPARARRGSRSR